VNHKEHKEHKGDGRTSKASVEADLAEARKNHAAVEEVMKRHAGKAKFIEIARASRDRYAQEIIELERELEALK
jgi:hypothetical protein